MRRVLGMDITSFQLFIYFTMRTSIMGNGDCPQTVYFPYCFRVKHLRGSENANGSILLIVES
jgi:hypothetical protein